MEVSLTWVIAVGGGLLLLGLSIWALVAVLRIGKKMHPGQVAPAIVQQTAPLLIDRPETGERPRMEDLLRDRSEIQDEHRQAELAAAEERLIQREQTLEQRASNLALREEMMARREKELSDLRDEAEQLSEQSRTRLEHISGLNAEEAKEEILHKVKEQARREAMILLRDSDLHAREEANRRARRILATAIERMSSQVVSETTVAAVELPNDDLKGRIIGREGRNIRSFESITGVTLIVDETPNSVMVSAFDPIRKETARITLENLVADGRIYPASIEEFFEKAKTQVEQSVRDAGEWAILDVGLTQIHPEMVTLLGRLKYRTSYGQTVLNHLVESAHIAALLAEELGVDSAHIRRSAFLHDIGKAVTHEVQGSHALIGAEIARRFGEDPAVVHGIEAHHNEVEPRTLLATLVQAADTVSASRPGARNNNLSQYIQRLERLEGLVRNFKGVQQVYAMQAGREVRIVVDSGTVDDAGASDLAREVARQIETELRYPNRVQVTVIREVRATDYAR